MTPLLWLLVCLAGGVGAVARFVFDGAVRARCGSRLPWGTLVINLSGSFALGLVTGIVGAHLASPALQAVLGSGFLGGYTTFSTASVETVRLLQERRLAAAAGTAAGMLLGACVAAAAGLWLGMGLGQSISMP